MRLAQLSELPEDPEPSSSLGACILCIILLQLLAMASLPGCALIQFFLLLTQRSVERVPQFFLLLYEIGLCLAGILMASEKNCYAKLFLWFIAMLFHLIIMELNSSNSKASDLLKPRAF